MLIVLVIVLALVAVIAYVAFFFNNTKVYLDRIEHLVEITVLPYKNSIFATPEAQFEAACLLMHFAMLHYLRLKKAKMLSTKLVPCVCAVLSKYAPGYDMDTISQVVMTRCACYSKTEIGDISERLYRIISNAEETDHVQACEISGFVPIIAFGDVLGMFRMRSSINEWMKMIFQSKSDYAIGEYLVKLESSIGKR